MTHPIVFRVSALPDAPDFDAFEINEDTEEERFIGYVMVPRVDTGASAPPIILNVVNKDHEWSSERMPFDTPWDEATQVLYMKLVLNIENVDKRWHAFEPKEHIRVSLRYT